MSSLASFAPASARTAHSAAWVNEGPWAGTGDVERTACQRLESAGSVSHRQYSHNTLASAAMKPYPNIGSLSMRRRVSGSRLLPDSARAPEREWLGTRAPRPQRNHLQAFACPPKTSSDSSPSWTPPGSQLVPCPSGNPPPSAGLAIQNRPSTRCSAMVFSPSSLRIIETSSARQSCLTEDGTGWCPRAYRHSESAVFSPDSPVPGWLQLAVAPIS